MLTVGGQNRLLPAEHLDGSGMTIMIAGIVVFDEWIMMAC
jgi:hypothetical protein